MGLFVLVSSKYKNKHVAHLPVNLTNLQNPPIKHVAVTFSHNATFILYFN